MEENRIEEMLSTLITMVGSIRKEQENFSIQLKEVQKDIIEMKQDIKVLQQDMLVVKQDIQVMKKDSEETKNENDRKHQEILTQLKMIKADQDLIWEIAVRNEREIVKVKSQL